MRPKARIPAGAVLLLIFWSLGGCGRAPGVIFEPLAQPLVWPAPPETARVRYVGQLATSADLKPGASLFQGMGEALFGKAQNYSMLSPLAVCTDGADRVFVADSNAQLVHVFDLKTRKYQRWKPTGKNVAPFSQPVGIAYDPSGRLYVSDSMAGAVFVFDNEGRFQGQIGRGKVQRPAGMAFDAARGRLWVVDVATHTVVALGRQGELLKQLGGRGLGPGQFNYPTNVALDSQGRVYVSDSLNFRVQQFGADLKFVRQIGGKGDRPGSFSQPKGVACDAEDHLYVIDAHFEAIQVFDSEGRLLMDFGAEGRGHGEFWLPTGVCIDRGNWIWVADSYNRRVQVFQYLPEAKP